jgi:hypothetical protein
MPGGFMEFQWNLTSFLFDLRLCIFCFTPAQSIRRDAQLWKLLKQRFFLQGTVQPFIEKRDIQVLIVDQRMKVKWKRADGLWAGEITGNLVSMHFSLRSYSRFVKSGE